MTKKKMIQFDFSKSGIPEGKLKPEPFPLANEGWRDLPFDKEGVATIKEVAKKFSEKFENLIVLGIGGSSQGLKALAQVLLPPKIKSRLWIQESPDPKSVAALLETFDLSKTCLNVISKSGNTIETTTLFEHFAPKFDKVQMVVTTEEGDGKLYAAVREKKLTHLPIPKNVGGRFSVFSAVGLFPLAFLGVDIDSLLEGARKALSNPENAHKNGLLHYLLNKDHGKTISVMMPYSDCLYDFGRWYAQLWGESLGKEGKGQTPLVALGPQDQHSLAQLFLDGPKDKVVTIMTVKTHAKDPLGQLLLREASATAQALHEKKCPCVSIHLDDLSPQTLGELLMSYQIQTAFTGHLMGINPYDQPAVELIKRRI